MSTEQNTHFNFRHVMEAIGMPSKTHYNWVMGRAIRKLTAEMGYEPIRELTPKTDPNPKVRAPHVIASYPMEIFPVVVAHCRQMWDCNPDNADVQLQLFDERIDTIS
jgi:hypothetical protein